MSEYMKMAIEEARSGIHNGEGGPFGCVIVKESKIVGKGHNEVLSRRDPTCHGEMQAIRQASLNLSTQDLSGCELYTTGEPCPMCLAACLWANIQTVYYGCSIRENSALGFRDAKFDKLLGGRKHLEGFLKCLDRDACLALFEEYQQLQAPRY